MATPTNSPKHDLGSLHIPERQRRDNRTVKRVIFAAIPVLLLAGIVVLAYTFVCESPQSTSRQPQHRKQLAARLS